MATDFDIRGQEGRFPPTRKSALASIGSEDPALAARAFETLVRAYWKPVYAHVRLRWSKPIDDAQDLTQEFFSRALEKRHFTSFDPARARFRTYLRGALDKFVLEASRADRREKRGGALTRLSLDFDLAEAELGRLGSTNADTCFETEWTRSLFSAALDAFESKCAKDGKRVHAILFRRYVVEPEVDASGRKPSYVDLAKELDLSVTDVTNHLSWARRTFRELVLDELRSITATDEEFKDEARAMLGIEP